MADEEYQFPSDDNTSTSSTGSSGTGINKMVLLPLAAILAAVVYTKMTSKQSEQQAVKPQAQVVNTQPSPIKPVALEPLVKQAKPLDAIVKPVSTPPKPSVNEKVVSDLKKTIKKHEATSSLQDKKIKKLEAQIVRMKLLLTATQAKVDALTEKKVIKAKKEAAKRAALRYTIRAMLPGRAWLSSNQGHSLSVTIGDSLGGDYGKVTEINPHDGTITTSSGMQILLGHNDR